jgi:DNA polymerase III epsilon subunit-like protein
MSRWPRIFVDVETTGLDPSIHEIIEICVITEWQSGSFEEWHTKIRPEHIETAHPRALEVNGYTAEAWRDAPIMAYVINDIAARVSQGLVIGHNVGFDVSFIAAALSSHGLRRPSHRSFDTMALAYEHLPIPKVSLDAIRSFFGWPSKRAHTALQDTRDMRRLFHRLYRASCFQRLWYRLIWTIRDA